MSKSIETPELNRDLYPMKLRNVLDLDRHYKKWAGEYTGILGRDPNLKKYRVL